MRVRWLAASARLLFGHPVGWLFLGGVFLVLDLFTGRYVLFPVGFVLPVVFASWHRGLSWAISLAVVLPGLRFALALEEGMPIVASSLNMLIRMAVLTLLAVILVRSRRIERNHLVTQEQIHVAAAIQQHLFPAAPLELAGFDIAGLNRPADATGGDLYDYLRMPDGCVGIVVGDVSGHGLGPALLMAETHAYMRALALTGTDPGEILTIANRLICEAAETGRFVSLFLGCLDVHRRTFVHAGAGHEGYLLDSSGEARKLPPTGLPLGVEADRIIGCSDPITLENDVIIVVLTDGVSEAHSPGGESFGVARALDVVRAHRSLGARRIAEAILQAVTAFTETGSTTDDVTAVVIKTTD